jgi:hypothetical protein
MYDDQQQYEQSGALPIGTAMLIVFTMLCTCIGYLMGESLYSAVQGLTVGLGIYFGLFLHVVIQEWQSDNEE